MLRVLSAFDASARKQSAFGGYNMSTGVKAVAGCGCKAGWFEMWLSRP